MEELRAPEEKESETTTLADSRRANTTLDVRVKTVRTGKTELKSAFVHIYSNIISKNDVIQKRTVK